ncbi:MAG: RimK family alpha-L-glutamate ligase [Planctomycetaceae bacterium]
MRLVVVGAARGWHATRIAAEASRRGHGVTVVEWPLLGAAIDPAGRPAVERFLPAAVDAADVLAVRSMPAGRLEEVILRMDLLGRIAARGTPVINAPAALETAIDKYLSLARLAAAGIPVPRTVVAQDPDAIRAAWESLGRDAVVKPLFGSCGRGIERVASAESLGRLVAAAAEGGTATYLQAFVPHDGWDVRVLLVGPRAFAMRRRARGDWRTNLALGGTAEPIDPPAAWLDLARRAASLLGVEVAGVDLLPGPDGMVVLEVNAVPGWQGLEGATGADVTGAVVERLAARAAGAA